MVIGSVIIPLSERLTLRTISAWSSIARFLWMKPIPPSRANAIASRCSVTVSMAELVIGTFIRILRVSCVLTSASAGNTRDSAGTSSTSSKVSPSRENLSSQSIVICLLLSFVGCHLSVVGADEGQVTADNGQIKKPSTRRGAEGSFGDCRDQLAGVGVSEGA